MHVISKLLAASILACAAVSASAVAAPSPYSALVVFGDSLSDSGNNSNLGAFGIGADPGQVITSNFYIPTQTYSPAPFGTYSNGPVWTTQFGAMLGLGVLPSLLGGTNYAFGGATTSGGLVPSLLAQLTAPVAPSNPFPGYLATHGGLADPDALYVVAGGGNNARATFDNVVSTSDFGLIGSVIGHDAAAYANDVGTMVDLLQAAGAQHIIVWNAPNLGLTPALRGVPSAFTGSGLSGTQIGSLIGGNFNGALQSRLAGEAGVQIFDLYGIAARAASPGFTNTSDACGVTNTICATSLFWDGIHPTTAAHGAIAAEMFALAAPVPEPTTVAMMLAGLLVIARVARRRVTGATARHLRPADPTP